MVLRGEGKGDQSLLAEYKGGEHKKVTAIKGIMRITQSLK